MPQNTSSNVQTEATSKPRTIIRMLSSKFTPRPSPPSAPVELSKEQRDAALRARGLFPQQQAQPPQQNSDAGLPSAADLIKREWAAKNQILERERINSFKFGGPSSQIAAQKQLPSPPNSPLEGEGSPEMIPPSLQTPPDTPQFGNADGISFTNGVLSPPSPTTPISLSPPTPHAKWEKTTSTEQKVLDEPFHQRMDSFAQLEASISSAVTPSMDSSSQITDSSSSLPSLASAAGGKFKVSALGSPLRGLQLKAHEGPSVPVIVESPVDFHFSEDLAVVVEESASTSLADLGEVVVDENNDKVDDNGNVEKDDNRVIPLVPLRRTAAAISTATPTALSPNSPQRSLVVPAPKSPTISGASPTIGPSRAQKRGMTDPTPVSAEGKRKILNPFKRGQTLAGEQSKDKVSTTDKAVDDTAVGLDVGNEDGKAVPRPRRLTMGSSFSNLRRSFVGTLSRPSNSGGPNSKGFNASHLPPSPTIPSSFNAGPPSYPLGAARSRSRGGSGGSGSNEGRLGVNTTSSPRICQPIAMYNHGTIQFETAAIEDDETRRMTELAFLG